MGYELKMHFGIVGRWSFDIFRNNPDEQGIYLQEVGCVDLCKCGYDSEIYNVSRTDDKDILPALLYREVKNRDFAIDELGNKISTDPIDEETGSEHVVEDCYGEKMPLVDAYVALAALVQANKQTVKEDGVTYRWYDVAIAALKAFIQSFDKAGSGKYDKTGEVLAVYFFGH